MVVKRIRAKYFAGLLSFLILMLVAVVTAQPAEAQVMVQDSADLSVQKFDFPPNQVNVGEPLFYELNIANFGPDSSTANNAVVVDRPAIQRTEFLFTISGNCSNVGQHRNLRPGRLGSRRVDRRRVRRMSGCCGDRHEHRDGQQRHA